jgi:hypothetical protein
MNKTRFATGLFLLTLTLSFSACKEHRSSPVPDKEPVGSTEPTAESEPTVEPGYVDVSPDGKIPLSILYVGLPDTEREEDFVSFLSLHFAEVRSIDLLNFEEGQTQDSDVVIMDKDGIQWGSRGGNPLSDYAVSRAYSKPTVTVGTPGAFWTSTMGLKTGYM